MKSTVFQNWSDRSLGDILGSPASLGLERGFRLSVALFHRGLAAELYPPLVIDTDTFHPDYIANLDDVLHRLDSEIRQFGDVHQSVLAGQDFYERPELFDGDNSPVIGFADFDLFGHASDDFFCPIQAIPAR